MNRLAWRLPTSTQEAYHRASGRRAYNARRGMIATARRIKLIELIKAGHTNAEIARMFGVHRSQITRDIKASTLLQLLDFRRLNRIWGRVGRKGK
jgi:DNA-binding NarL/FixJ family response regulator